MKIFLLPALDKMASPVVSLTCAVGAIWGFYRCGDGSVKENATLNLMQRLPANINTLSRKMLTRRNLQPDVLQAYTFFSSSLFPVKK